MAAQADTVNKLAAFCGVSCRYFILRENCSVRTFRYTGATINTGIRIDIEKRPLFLWLAWGNTFYGANLHTPAISQTQAGDNVRHNAFSFLGWMNIIIIAVF
jgi:hypothetical protein